MPKLTLILGKAGSGKTEMLVEQVCRRAATSPLASPEHPPLLVVVPEQQALMTEQALLARLGKLLGRPAATSRIRVMSLSRLGNWLCAQAGLPVRRDGDLGRRLLVWRILSQMEEEGRTDGRAARAEQLSEVLAELRQFGTAPQQLRQRADELAGQPAPSRSAEELPQRLRDLAELLERYQADCDARGLQFSSTASHITRLLSGRLWPLLEYTEVFIDGFAGFTPPEEEALLAILSRSRSVTAAVLLDPARRRGPDPADSADWFAPGRELHDSLVKLATRCGIRPEYVELEGTPRWEGEALPLATLATEGTLPFGRSGTDVPLTCIVCNDERTEVLEAVRTVRRLMRDQELRPSQISIIARDLEPYAELLQMRLSEHGIPAFIDRRMPLSYHPLLQLLRGLLRLAAGLAGREELAGLLRCGLLPFDEQTEGLPQRDAVDRLLKYADGHGLPVQRWLEEREWNWHRELGGDEDRQRFRRDPDEVRAELARLDRWRRQLLVQVVELQEYISSEGASLDGLAEMLRNCMPAEDDPRLQEPADDIVRGRVEDLLAEMELLGGGLLLHGEAALELREVVNWLEYGFSRLQQAMPPLRQDHLLVTEVERGRHHPVRASILLGMADGSWPPQAQDSPWFSDSQREMINGNEKLLSAGSREDCLREPWLAMIAVTRASQQLFLLRPGADSEGRRRPPSPWYSGMLEWSGQEECKVSHEQAQRLSQVESEGDLVQALAISGAPAVELPGLSAAVSAALDWARNWKSRRGRTQYLLPQLATRERRGGALSLSATRLEQFAACPYKHYVRYWLRLDEDREPAFDALTLGNMYHTVFERTVERLNREGFDWLGSDWQQISERSREELEQLRLELSRETARERVDYVLERAGILLEQHSRRIGEWLSENGGRLPLQTELRFGSAANAQLPPYEFETAGGRLRISGFIDRLDVDAAGNATIVDYKLGRRRRDWNRFLAGYQLQLFVYMLAIRGRQLGNSPPLEPADAEYQPVEVQWDSSGSAEFSAVQVFRPNGRLGEDKAAEARQRLHDWALEETRRVLSELGGRLLAAEVRAWPLTDGRNWTACNGCPSRSICRFDPVAGDSYREMPPQNNTEIQKLVLEEQPDFSGSALHSSSAAGEDGDA